MHVGIEVVSRPLSQWNIYDIADFLYENGVHMNADNWQKIADDMRMVGGDIRRLIDAELQEKQDEIDDLNFDYARLEDKNDDLESEVSSLEDDCSEKDSTIRDLESEVSEKETEISDLQERISALEERISDLESNYNEMD